MFINRISSALYFYYVKYQYQTMKWKVTIFSHVELTLYLEVIGGS